MANINCFCVIVIFLISTVESRRPMGYGLGSSCQYDEDCVPPHSFCRRQEVCDCKRGFIASEDSTQCLTLVGAFCQSSYDCSSLQHSECREERCLCENRFIANEGGTECLPTVMQYQGGCKLDSQCKAMMGEGSYCYLGRCECQSYHHFSKPESRCLRSKSLFEQCRNNSECYIGDYYSHTVECRGGQCNCRYGYMTTENRKCINSSTNIASIPAVIFLTTVLNAVLGSFYK